MTVEELIEDLKQCDPDWVIVDSNSDFILSITADKDNEEIRLEIE